MHVGKKHRWSKKEKDFIKNSWRRMCTKDIASVLGCSTTTVLEMGNTLKLEPKRKTGRITTVESLKMYRERFKHGERLKLQFKKGKHIELFEGVVIDKTDCLVVLRRNNNIRGSFNYRDFITGDIKILEEAM